MPYSAQDLKNLHRAGMSVPSARRKQAGELATALVPSTQNVYESGLQKVNSSGTVLADNTIYWVYVGRVLRPETLVNAEFAVEVAGLGAQTAELAFAASTPAPARASQTLTCVACSTAITSTLTTGLKRSTADINYKFGLRDVGSHLWAAVRIHMATTQPEVYGLTADLSGGSVLTTSSSSAIAVGSSYTGALIAHALTWQAPHLRVWTV